MGLYGERIVGWRRCSFAAGKLIAESPAWLVATTKRLAAASVDAVAGVACRDVREGFSPRTTEAGKATESHRETATVPIGMRPMT